MSFEFCDHCHDDIPSSSWDHHLVFENQLIRLRDKFTEKGLSEGEKASLCQIFIGLFDNLTNFFDFDKEVKEKKH